MAAACFNVLISSHYTILITCISHILGLRFSTTFLGILLRDQIFIKVSVA